MDEQCIFCGEDNETVLQQHHQVPRRLNGSDAEYNLITLCANCHQIIENLYDDDFYERLGVNTGIKSQDSSSQEDQELPTVREVAKKFVRECCTHQPAASTTSASLMRAFNAWVESNGYSYEQDSHIALQFILRNAEYAEWVDDASWDGRYSIHISNELGRFLGSAAESLDIEEDELAETAVRQYLEQEVESVPDSLDEFGRDLDFMMKSVVDEDDPFDRNPAATTEFASEDYEWHGRIDGLKLNLD